MKSIGKALLWIIGIGILLLIPTAGGKIFDAVTSKMEEKEAAPIELKDINRAPAAEAASGNAEAAKERYLEGLKYFQASNYEKAGEEWLEAQELDPYNQQVQEGLKRIRAISAKTQPE